MPGRRSNLIGLIMPDISYPFSVEAMKGVNRALSKWEGLNLRKGMEFLCKR
jgi:DNA-binding LacI/PurR family transcriptional regulator